MCKFGIFGMIPGRVLLKRPNFPMYLGLILAYFSWTEHVIQGHVFTKWAEPWICGFVCSNWCHISSHTWNPAMTSIFWRSGPPPKQIRTSNPKIGPNLWFQVYIYIRIYIHIYIYCEAPCKKNTFFASWKKSSHNKKSGKNGELGFYNHSHLSMLFYDWSPKVSGT